NRETPVPGRPARGAEFPEAGGYRRCNKTAPAPGTQSWNRARGGGRRAGGLSARSGRSHRSLAPAEKTGRNHARLRPCCRGRWPAADAAAELTPAVHTEEWGRHFAVLPAPSEFPDRQYGQGGRGE